MQDKVLFGVVNDMQRMSMNDGPGYRTLVFLKGCVINCEWCHNPEGKRRYPEVIPHFGNCNGCGECIDVCSTGALSLNEDNRPRIDNRLCTTCLQCVKICRVEGLVVWGKIMTVEQVMDEVMRDKEFYLNSGGGMTLSGGEPMAQPEFATALMKAAKDQDISTALDTCGHAPWKDYEKILKYTDLVLLDIKHMDTIEHKSYAGTGNELILKNAGRIAELDVPLRIRIPIIPGRNDSEKNWKETALFVESLGDAVMGVDLLPYHPYAGGKYKAFGMDYPYPAGEGLDDEFLVPVIDLFLEHVPEVTVGG
jgi:pyruvate formate lyase activating enzyme